MDPHHVDEDPDPTYNIGADPDPDFYLCGSGSSFFHDADGDSDSTFHFDADPRILLFCADPDPAQVVR